MERIKRLGKIQRVLKRTLFLNFLVCIIKIALGMFTGILAITADGIHSLGDSLSNVAGISVPTALVGILFLLSWMEKKN